MAEKELTKEDEKAVFWWLKLRDVGKVADRIRLTKAQTKNILDRIAVQDEIERQENILITERMRIQANAENLANDLLDRELLSIITLDAEIDPGAKHKAILTGYVLTGRLETSTVRSLEAKEGPDAKANFYQGVIQGSINVTPILPDEAKDHKFLPPPPPPKPEPVTATVSSVRPRSEPSKVKVW